MAIDSPEAFDGDDNGVWCVGWWDVGDKDSDGVGVDSLNSDDGDSVCTDSDGGVFEDSDKEDFEDLDIDGSDEEDPDVGDWLVFLLIATANICLNWITLVIKFWFKND